MQKRTLFSIGSWVGITFALWVIAWVIAEAIPVFNDLLSLIVSDSLLACLEIFLILRILMDVHHD